MHNKLRCNRSAPVAYAGPTCKYIVVDKLDFSISDIQGQDLESFGLNRRVQISSIYFFIALCIRFSAHFSFSLLLSTNHVTYISFCFGIILNFVTVLSIFTQLQYGL